MTREYLSSADRCPDSVSPHLAFSRGSCSGIWLGRLGSFYGVWELWGWYGHGRGWPQGVRFQVLTKRAIINIPSPFHAPLVNSEQPLGTLERFS